MLHHIPFIHCITGFVFNKISLFFLLRSFIDRDRSVASDRVGLRIFENDVDAQISGEWLSESRLYGGQSSHRRWRPLILLLDTVVFR